MMRQNLSEKPRRDSDESDRPKLERFSKEYEETRPHKDPGVDDLAKIYHNNKAEDESDYPFHGYKNQGDDDGGPRHSHSYNERSDRRNLNNDQVGNENDFVDASKQLMADFKNRFDEETSFRTPEEAESLANNGAPENYGKTDGGAVTANDLVTGSKRFNLKDEEINEKDQAALQRNYDEEGEPESKFFRQFFAQAHDKDSDSVIGDNSRAARLESRFYDSNKRQTIPFSKKDVVKYDFQDDFREPIDRREITPSRFGKLTTRETILDRFNKPETDFDTNHKRDSDEDNMFEDDEDFPDESEKSNEKVQEMMQHEVQDKPTSDTNEVDKLDSFSKDFDESHPELHSSKFSNKLMTRDDEELSSQKHYFSKSLGSQHYNHRKQRDHEVDQLARLYDQNVPEDESVGETQTKANIKSDHKNSNKTKATNSFKKHILGTGYSDDELDPSEESEKSQEKVQEMMQHEVQDKPTSDTNEVDKLDSFSNDFDESHPELHKSKFINKSLSQGEEEASSNKHAFSNDLGSKHHNQIQQRDHEVDQLARLYDQNVPEDDSVGESQIKTQIKTNMRSNGKRNQKSKSDNAFKKNVLNTGYSDDELDPSEESEKSQEKVQEMMQHEVQDRPTSDTNEVDRLDSFSNDFEESHPEIQKSKFSNRSLTREEDESSSKNHDFVNFAGSKHLKKRKGGDREVDQLARLYDQDVPEDQSVGETQTKTNIDPNKEKISKFAEHLNDKKTKHNSRKLISLHVREKTAHKKSYLKPHIHKKFRTSDLPSQRSLKGHSSHEQAKKKNAMNSGYSNEELDSSLEMDNSQDKVQQMMQAEVEDKPTVDSAEVDRLDAFSKDFEQDHPELPQNKFAKHSESSEDSNSQENLSKFSNNSFSKDFEQDYPELPKSKFANHSESSEDNNSPENVSKFSNNSANSEEESSPAQQNGKIDNRKTSSDNEDDKETNSEADHLAKILRQSLAEDESIGETQSKATVKKIHSNQTADDITAHGKRKSIVKQHRSVQKNPNTTQRRSAQKISEKSLSGNIIIDRIDKRDITSDGIRNKIYSSNQDVLLKHRYKRLLKKIVEPEKGPLSPISNFKYLDNKNSNKRSFTSIFDKMVYKLNNIVKNTQR